MFLFQRITRRSRKLFIVFSSTSEQCNNRRKVVKTTGSDLGDEVRICSTELHLHITVKKYFKNNGQKKFEK
jgi:hypothetical protein